MQKQFMTCASTLIQSSMLTLMKAVSKIERSIQIKVIDLNMMSIRFWAACALCSENRAVDFGIIVFDEKTI